MLTRDGKPITWARIVISLAAAATLAMAASVTWTGPVPVAEGQTIPWPTPTATPLPTSIPTSTHTPTPRPTWTLVPTSAPQTPSKAPTEPVAAPTHGQATAAPATTAIPTPTSAVSASAQATSTASPAAPLATPRPAPTAVSKAFKGLQALLFEVAAEPLFAGPGDEVRFTVQVANVGYAPIAEARIAAVLPTDLLLHTVNCPRCSFAQTSGRLTLELGDLPSGDQWIITVLIWVAEDAWPGQALATSWELAARGQSAQAAEISIELPWAELPATGECPEHRRSIHQQDWT